MPADEPPRRRKRIRRSHTRASSPGAKGGNHESSAPLAPESLERPATLDELRKARIEYLDTPPVERQRKMKYEYEKTVKVKARAPSKSAPTKEGSTVSKAKSSAKSEHRSTRSRSRKTEQAGEEEESQFVYGRPQPKDQMPGSFDVQNNDREGDVRRSRTTSKSKRVASSGTTRRHTEPVVKLAPVGNTASAQSSSRPQLRRNSTTRTNGLRSATQRSSIPPGAEPEIATASPAAATTRKSGSVFGGLFGAKSPPVERKAPCLTCGDEVSVGRTAKLPCTHRMCHSCLKRLFKLAVTDPAHMPPRCCTEQAIDLKHVDSLFSQEFKKNYNRKFKEFKAKNKIYCPAPGCGEWVQPKHMMMDKGRKIGRCPSCKTYVCGICSQKMHKTRDCPKDPATKEFTEAAKKAGWQKCYNCSMMVELKEGCNHMTCRCTAEFCMMCGLKWKSCDCPWFNYDQVDVLGDPVRFQQEMDRRNEQERRDEAMARRIEALQLDGDRPALFEWLNLGNGANRQRNQNFVRQARQALAGNYTDGDQAARGILDDFLAHGEERMPIMPGGWDDGPHQFQQIPPLPRRYQRDDPDPAAEANPDRLPEIAGAHGVPVIRRRSYRRRVVTPDSGVFERRILTAEEREQERDIRAWATGRHEE